MNDMLSTYQEDTLRALKEMLEGQTLTTSLELDSNLGLVVRVKVDCGVIHYRDNPFGLLTDGDSYLITNSEIREPTVNNKVELKSFLVSVILKHTKLKSIEVTQRIIARLTDKEIYHRVVLLSSQQ
mgnify:CR=1 FL=1